MDHAPFAAGTTAETATGSDSSLTSTASTETGPGTPTGSVQFEPETVVEAPGLSAPVPMVRTFVVAAPIGTVTGV